MLDGHAVSVDEALAILQSPDDELLDLLAAAYRIRRRWFGNTVQLYFLMNAKSGLCPEDCRYCSQSKVSEAEIPRYNLLSRDKLLDGARMAAERGSKTYCIVISARGPSEREMQAVETIVPEIKRQYDLEVCACLGLLDARAGPAAGGLRRQQGQSQPQHQREFYEQICTTHTYEDRVATLRAVRAGGPGAVLAAASSAWASGTKTSCGWRWRCASWGSSRSRSTF